MSKMLTAPMLRVLKNAAQGCPCTFGLDSPKGSAQRLRSLQALEVRGYVADDGSLTKSGAQALKYADPDAMSDFAVGLLLPKASQEVTKRTIDLCDRFGLVPTSRYPSPERGGRLTGGLAINQLANLIAHVEREAKEAALVSMVSPKANHLRPKQPITQPIRRPTERLVRSLKKAS